MLCISSSEHRFWLLSKSFRRSSVEQSSGQPGARHDLLASLTQALFALFQLLNGALQLSRLHEALPLQQRHQHAGDERAFQLLSSKKPSSSSDAQVNFE